MAGWPGLGLVLVPLTLRLARQLFGFCVARFARSSASSCFHRSSSSPCSPFLSPLHAFSLAHSLDEDGTPTFLGRVPVLTVALHPSPRRFASVSPTQHRLRVSSRKGFINSPSFDGPNYCFAISQCTRQHDDKKLHLWSLLAGRFTAISEQTLLNNNLSFTRSVKPYL